MKVIEKAIIVQIPDDFWEREAEFRAEEILQELNHAPNIWKEQLMKDLLRFLE